MLALPLGYKREPRYERAGGPIAAATAFLTPVSRALDIELPSHMLGAHCRLPNHPILPLGLSDVSGTTSLFATYVSRSPGWKLGVQTSLPWPRCIRRTIGGSNAIISTVNGSSYYIGWDALLLHLYRALSALLHLMCCWAHLVPVRGNRLHVCLSLCQLVLPRSCPSRR